MVAAVAQRPFAFLQDAPPKTRFAYYLLRTPNSPLHAAQAAFGSDNRQFISFVSSNWEHDPEVIQEKIGLEQQFGSLHFRKTLTEIMFELELMGNDALATRTDRLNAYRELQVLRRFVMDQAQAAIDAQKSVAEHNEMTDEIAAIYNDPPPPRQNKGRALADEDVSA